MNYKQQEVANAVTNLRKEGFTVYLAASKEYGFFTDESEQNIVSFQNDLGGLRVSGNYTSKACGTGWGITSELSPSDFTPENAKKWLSLRPPHWATSGEKVQLRTVADQLRIYGASSKYTLVD